MNATFEIRSDDSFRQSYAKNQSSFIIKQNPTTSKLVGVPRKWL